MKNNAIFIILFYFLTPSAQALYKDRHLLRDKIGRQPTQEELNAVSFDSKNMFYEGEVVIVAFNRQRDEPPTELRSEMIQLIDATHALALIHDIAGDIHYICFDDFRWTLWWSNWRKCHQMGKFNSEYLKRVAQNRQTLPPHESH